MARPIHEIALEIFRKWKNINYAAYPYLEAMRRLDSIRDMYGLDRGEHIVAYFLSNATGWRGSDARRIKKELNHMLHVSNPRIYKEKK